MIEFEDITNCSDEFLDGYRQALNDVYNDLKNEGISTAYDLHAALISLKQKGK